MILTNMHPSNERRALWGQILDGSLVILAITACTLAGVRQFTARQVALSGLAKTRTGRSHPEIDGYVLVLIYRIQWPS